MGLTTDGKGLYCENENTIIHNTIQISCANLVGEINLLINPSTWRPKESYMLTYLGLDNDFEWVSFGLVIIGVHSY